MLVLLLLVVSTSCFAWSLFGPKNYDECILENMKNVNNDIAAREVKKSCRMKFKDKEVDNSPRHNWILYQSDDESSSYYDNSTITTNGKVVTVELLVDFNKLQSFAKEGKSSKESDEFYSYTEKIEYDCGNLIYRSLSTEVTSGHMGDGITRHHMGLGEEEKFTKENGAYKRYCS